MGLATINDYLKGKGEPTTKTLEKLADYFGVSVSQLRGEESIVTSPMFWGLTRKGDIGAFQEKAIQTQRKFELALDENYTFNNNIHYLHSVAKEARDLLQAPDPLYSDSFSGAWENLKCTAQAVIEKFQKTLEAADDETKAFFSQQEYRLTARGNFYDLVTTPDYFTRLTAVFDDVISLPLKSKQVQKNKMFLAVAVSLAKLLRDMPRELADVYDAEYLQELQALAIKVINEIDSEQPMEIGTHPSIKPKLNQRVKESGQHHQPATETADSHS